jgi:hypothetical protein
MSTANKYTPPAIRRLKRGELNGKQILAESRTLADGNSKGSYTYRVEIEPGQSVYQVGGNRLLKEEE